MSLEEARRNGLVVRYVNIMFDDGFKRVFGQEANKDLLIALLREILPDLDIQTLRLINVENQGLGRDSKRSTFDVCCTTGDGKEIIVEMQVKKQEWFADRAVYYATLPIHRMVKKGQKKYKLRPIYFVSLLDFEMEHEHTPGPGEYEWRYSIREERCGEKLTNTLNFVFIELSKFNKTEEELCSLKEKWYFCFRHMKDLSKRPEVLQEAIFKRLFDVTEIESMNVSDRISYIKSMTTERDIYNQMDYARKEGVAQGKAEIARNFLAAGVDIKIIASCTGLTEEQIKAL